MYEETNVPLTAIDQIANGDQLQMIKAALPYMMQPEQKYAAIYTKIMEIQNILSFYQETQDISICSLEQEETSIIDVFQDLKKYCPESQKAPLEQYIQIIQIMNIFQSSKSTDRSQDLMKNLLSPEQQSLFETYQTMFSTT